MCTDWIEAVLNTQQKWWTLHCARGSTEAVIITSKTLTFTFKDNNYIIEYAWNKCKEPQKRSLPLNKVYNLYKIIGSDYFSLFTVVVGYRFKLVELYHFLTKLKMAAYSSTYHTIWSLKASLNVFCTFLLPIVKI